MKSDDRVGHLVKLAGRRPMPDSAQMSSARAAARAEWARIVERRAWRVSLWRLTGAALAIVTLSSAIWFGLRPSPAPPPGIEIATLQTMTGSLFVTGSEGRRPVTQTGVRLRSGDRIETPEGSRAAVSMDRDISLRLDWSTSVILHGADRLTLERGAVYVDAGTLPRDFPLRVSTSFGSVHHVGTQFEVRLHDDALGVRVREGAIAIERAGTRWTARAGERLLLARNRPPERQAIATYGSDWSWIGELARPFPLEGAAVPRFLDWASRELGVRWDYANPAMRHHVEEIVLHGSLEGLTPEEALAAVLPTCGLAFHREGERIVISAAR